MKHADTFIVTTGRDGSARLSCPGQWGNMPFPCADSAHAEARRLGGASARIAREQGR